MAKHPHYSTTSLNRYQWLAGLLFFPFYLYLIPLGLSLLLPRLGVDLHTAAGALRYEVACFAVEFVVCILIFSGFLKNSFRIFKRDFMGTVQIVILGIVFCYALNFCVSLVTEFFRLAPVNDNQITMETLLTQNPWLIAICCCVLAPITEECMLRGLVFGGLHKKNRILAYIVSVLLFALLHVWQTAAYHSFANTLLVMLQYLPVSVALAWTYERSGTIWASITTHALLNAVSCGILVLR